jgi:hypothetical protein
MDDVRKYKIGLKSKDEEYTVCRVAELKAVYFEKDVQTTNTRYNGAVGLIRNSEYKGYCNLCMVYHSLGCDNFKNGYTVNFAPLYNEFGQMILIEYDRDDIYCAIDCRQEDYVKNQILDCEITFWNYGTFKEFAMV